MEAGILPINPIAIKFGFLEVHWYGIIIGLGIAISLYLAMREGEKHGIDKDSLADLMIWAIPIAIISARIYYVIFQWDYYSQYPGGYDQNLGRRHCHPWCADRFGFDSDYLFKDQRSFFLEIS